MKRYKEIIFNNDLSIRKQETFEYLLNQIKQVDRGNIVYIDLKNIQKMDSEKLVLLVITVYLLSSVVFQSIHIRASQEILDYLFSVDFFNLGYASRQNISVSKVTGRTVKVPIKKFVGSSGRRDLINMLRQHFRVNEEIKYPVLQVISNLSENCLEHTSSDPEKVDCFAFVEKVGDTAEIVVIDFGEGFYDSFFRNGKIQDVANNKDAVMKVLLEHGTSRVKAKTGFGIQVVEEIIKKHVGKMIIATGDVLVEMGMSSSGKVLEYGEIPFLKGSCIFVEINAEE